MHQFDAPAAIAGGFNGCDDSWRHKCHAVVGDDVSFDCHVSSWKSRKVLEYGDSRPLVTMQPSLEPVSWGWRCYVLIKYKKNHFDNCGEPCPLAISKHLILMIIYINYINMFAVSGAPVMFFKEQSPGDFLRAALLDDSGLWLLGRRWCWDVLRKLESTHQCTPKILWLAASFPSKNYAQNYWIERHFFQCLMVQSVSILTLIKRQKCEDCTSGFFPSLSPSGSSQRHKICATAEVWLGSFC